MADLDDTLDAADALAALTWQLEAGVDEAILDAPQDRFAENVKKPVAAPQKTAGAAVTMPVETPTTVLADQAPDLEGLRRAMAEFDGCALKKGAKNLVFADGLAGAHVMIVGEAPGRDEDAQGKPFVGRSGQLLDLMFAAIGLSRTAEDPSAALYITNTLPWRPPQNRDPQADELAMMLPFLKRHIQLAKPRLLVAMGNPANRALLQTTTGITRLRGQWQEVVGIPVMPMFHPAALLRDPLKKREAWADLLAVRARLQA